MSSVEPKWRQWLNWGAVISFFTMPTVFFTLQVIGIELKSFHFEEAIKLFGWTRDYFRVIAMLVFGLAGLNSWDRRNGAK